MFDGCSSLISIDLSNFDTSNVKYMWGMFYGCSSLISIDLSNFNMKNCISYNDMFSNNINIKYINIYNFKNDKIISYTFNNINNPIFICQKDKIINNPKAYYCCDSNLRAYNCSSINNINNIKSSNSISIGVIISIIAGGILVIIVIIIIIYCNFRKKDNKNGKPEENTTKIDSSKVYSENEEKIDTTSSRNTNNIPTNNSLIISKNNPSIFVHELSNDKDNPMIIIFQNPGFGDSNILIDSSKTIDELIRFYFEISKRKDLYGDESIIFLIGGKHIVPPYPKENIATLKDKITKSGTIKIVVVDNDDKMKTIAI